MRVSQYVAAIGCIFLAACNSEQQASEAKVAKSANDASAAAPFEFDGARIRADLEYLADDARQGRETGKPGYDDAAQYVADAFAEMGLKPGVGESYFQQIKFRAALLNKETSGMTLRAGERSVTPELGADYTLGAQTARTHSAVTAPLVFVGFGVHAPDQDHNDYAAINLEGKVAVMLGGSPPKFSGVESAYYGSSATKSVMAMSQGAVGVIVVYSPQLASVLPWELVSHRIDSPSLGWLQEDGEAYTSVPELKFSGLMSPEASAMLFEGAEKSYESIYEEARTGAPAGFDLAFTADVAVNSTHSEMESANVVGVLEGSDPALAGEYIVYTAHLDHLGVGESVDGDAIYNGALDNAAGVTIITEAARGFAQGPAKAKRSIMVVALTAEEQGLLGAQYFTKHPPTPIENLVANINVDLPGILFDYTSMIPLAGEHSTLFASAERAGEKMGLAISPSPDGQSGAFMRSDHFRFVEAGVPSTYLVNSADTAEGPQAGMPLAMDYLRTRYHRPTDDLSIGLDYDAAARFAEFAYLLGLEVANAQERAEWIEGTFLQERFGR